MWSIKEPTKELDNKEFPSTTKVTGLSGIRNFDILEMTVAQCTWSPLVNKLWAEIKMFSRISASSHFKTYYFLIEKNISQVTEFHKLYSPQTQDFLADPNLTVLGENGFLRCNAVLAQLLKPRNTLHNCFIQDSGTHQRCISAVIWWETETKTKAKLSGWICLLIASNNLRNSIVSVSYGWNAHVFWWVSFIRVQLIGSYFEKHYQVNLVFWKFSARGSTCLIMRTWGLVWTISLDSPVSSLPLSPFLQGTHLWQYTGFSCLSFSYGMSHSARFSVTGCFLPSAL